MTQQLSWKGLLPKVILGIIAVAVVAAPVFKINEVAVSIMSLSALWAIATMGFILILRTGQFSLGQAAFLAIGAYTSVMLSTLAGVPFWLSFLMAGVLSGLVAYVIGTVVLRVGGIYFSIITLAFTELVRVIAQQWPLTRGSLGLIPAPLTEINLVGLTVNFQANGVPYFYLTLILLAITVLVYWQIGRSRLGQTFRGLATNQILAEHVGIHLMKYRVIAYTVAGVFTGFAGAMYAQLVGIITPEMFGLWESIQVQMMGVLGGIGFMAAGSMVGALLLYGLGCVLSRLPVYGIMYLLYGGAVIAVLLFLPKGTGIVDLWGMFWRRIFGDTNKNAVVNKSGI
jgi:branched-chain amino acid transport system permease protein